VERGEGRLARATCFDECGHRQRRPGRGVGAIDRQPGVEGTVLPFGDGQVGFGQGARGNLAGAEQARHLVGVEAG